jgi:hypothetical protein
MHADMVPSTSPVTCRRKKSYYRKPDMGLLEGGLFTCDVGLRHCPFRNPYNRVTRYWSSDEWLASIFDGNFERQSRFLLSCEYV